jgi:hypothetical protein
MSATTTGKCVYLGSFSVANKWKHPYLLLSHSKKSGQAHFIISHWRFCLPPRRQMSLVQMNLKDLFLISKGESDSK